MKKLLLSNGSSSNGATTIALGSYDRAFGPPAARRNGHDNSHQDLADDMAMHISQAAIDAVFAESQPFMIDA